MARRFTQIGATLSLMGFPELLHAAVAAKLLQGSRRFPLAKTRGTQREIDLYSFLCDPLRSLREVRFGSGQQSLPSSLIFDRRELLESRIFILHDLYGSHECVDCRSHLR